MLLLCVLQASHREHRPERIRGIRVREPSLDEHGGLRVGRDGLHLGVPPRPAASRGPHFSLLAMLSLSHLSASRLTIPAHQRRVTSLPVYHQRCSQSLAAVGHMSVNQTAKYTLYVGICLRWRFCDSEVCCRGSGMVGGRSGEWVLPSA